MGCVRRLSVRLVCVRVVPRIMSLENCVLLLSDSDHLYNLKTSNDFLIMIISYHFSI
jgi:hypothetical protein